MRWFALVAVCVFGGCSGASPHEQALASAPGAAAVILFEGATLIDGETGAAVENAAFVVDGDRFGPVGRTSEVALPTGATRVDLTGKTVIPALVSAHMHVGLLDGNDFGPQVYTHEKIVEHLQRYAYYGVGAVFSAGTDVGPLSFAVRDERPPHAARLLTAGRGMAAPDGGPGFPAIARTSFPITTAEEGRQRVREVAAQGAQAVKIWVDDRGGRVKKLTPDLYRPIIEESHARGLKALAHVYYLKDAHELVEAGIDGFLHLVRDEVMDDALVASMKARNIFVTANIGGSHRATLTELPESSLARLAETVPAEVVTAYRASLRARDLKAVATSRATYGRMAQSLARLTTAGVTIALGGDTGIPTAWHGWAEHYELATMAGAGMTPAQVIVASTSVPARLLKLDDLGSVAAGKSADFVVLDANPLDDIANTQRIAAVYLRGQALDRAASRTRWTSPAAVTPRSSSTP
jgi:imidazolonepropionase-like amidohydrolase